MHFQGQPHGAQGVVGLVFGRVEEAHDAVANVLVERALVGQHQIGEGREVVVEDGLQHLGLDVLRHIGEAANVGEERGDHPALAAEQVAVGDGEQTLHDLRADAQAKRAAQALGGQVLKDGRIHLTGDAAQ